MTTAGEGPDPARSLAFLGPEGTFTHAAALGWQHLGEPVPLPTVHDVYSAVASGRSQYGVVAIESSVEGYVVPSLDEIVAAVDVVAVDETALRIEFDAFVSPGSTDPATRTQVSAHPHGLAQCSRFVARSGLIPVPAPSNAAACRDVGVDQVALGPSICGELYGLRTLEWSVQDFAGARTRFLLVMGRAQARAQLRDQQATDWTTAWRTMLAVTPHEIGPGVLARITEAFGSLGVNMTSLITRPLKAQEGTYVFVLTFDGAPWQHGVRSLFERLLAAGDSLKTLGVFPARKMFDGAFDSSRVPGGSARSTDSAEQIEQSLLW